jgi:hypothetical protein
VRFYRRALNGAEIVAFGAPNYGPDVTAGPASPATNRITSNINGRVVDDGKGGALSARWSKVAGPGNATFGNSNLVATSVTFDRSGNYVLRLSGSDTPMEMSQDLPLTVNSNTNVFEDWIAGYFQAKQICGRGALADQMETERRIFCALGWTPQS